MAEGRTNVDVKEAHSEAASEAVVVCEVLKHIKESKCSTMSFVIHFKSAPVVTDDTAMFFRKMSKIWKQ